MNVRMEVEVEGLVLVMQHTDRGFALRSWKAPDGAVSTETPELDDVIRARWFARREEAAAFAAKLLTEPFRTLARPFTQPGVTRSPR